MAARHDALLEAVIEEYGAPAARAPWLGTKTAHVICDSKHPLDAIYFFKTPPAATLQINPHRVAGVINTRKKQSGVILGKKSAPQRAGCNPVIKNT
ncbi:aldehyde dehydrogenase family protein, partial [Enterobacter hormaechei]